MAYTAFTPLFRVQEAQDATAFKIWDESTWTGESGNTTFCVVRLYHYAVDGTITQYDDYELITGADTTKFDEYLTTDGHVVEITAMTLASGSAGTVFEDGYYIVKIVYSEGSYAVGSEPYYDNTQAFLAKAKCKSRKLPAKLTWPITDASWEIDRDISAQNMYLVAAEDAADLAKETEYRNFVDLLNNIYSKYSIENCF